MRGRERDRDREPTCILLSTKTQRHTETDIHTFINMLLLSAYLSYFIRIYTYTSSHLRHHTPHIINMNFIRIVECVKEREIGIPQVYFYPSRHTKTLMHKDVIIIRIFMIFYPNLVYLNMNIYPSS